MNTTDNSAHSFTEGSEFNKPIDIYVIPEEWREGIESCRTVEIKTKCPCEVAGIAVTCFQCERITNPELYPKIQSKPWEQQIDDVFKNYHSEAFKSAVKDAIKGLMRKHTPWDDLKK